jgi:hypothetical protein
MTTDPNEITQATGLHPDWLSRELDIAAERLQTLASVKKQNQITEDAFDVATGYRMLRAQIIAEHPADDGEPVDWKWLALIGFDRAHVLEFFGKGGNGMVVRFHGWRLPDVKTRGDVLRLAKCLGIPLPDQPKGGV